MTYILCKTCGSTPSECRCPPPVPPHAAGEEDSVLEALKDALSGYLYIQLVHGRLDGVGWDRVEIKLRRAIGSLEQSPAASQATPVESVEAFLIDWQRQLAATDYSAPEYADRALIVDQLTQVLYSLQKPAHACSTTPLPEEEKT